MPGERERVILTEQDVAFALEPREIGPVHPVVSVLRQNSPRLSELEAQNAAIYENAPEWGDPEFVTQNYGFLADAFVEALPYTLTATDLIQIWTCAITILPTRVARTDMGGMISSAYAIQDLAESPEWRNVPRMLFETVELPAGVLGDREGLLRFHERLEEIMASYFDIDYYEL